MSKKANSRSTRTNADASNPPVPSGVLANEHLVVIRDRLDRSLPQGPYITESQFAKILVLAKKTVSNYRSEDKLRYPMPFALGGGRPKYHARSTIIDWLANQELLGMARIVHRCI